MIARRSVLLGALASIPMIGVSSHSGLAQDGSPPPNLRLSLKVDGMSDPILVRSTVDRTARVLVNRATLLGAATVSSTVTDDLRIVLDLAGLPDPERAVDTLTTRGLVEIINPLGQFLEAGAGVITSIGGDPWPDAEGVTILVTHAPVFETIISSEDIVEAYAFEDQFGAPVVGFTLSRRAAEDFEAYTAANIGLPMSIVVDNRVVSTPVVMAPISIGGEIQGLSSEEVDALVIQLSSPPLPARIEIDRVQIDPEAT